MNTARAQESLMLDAWVRAQLNERYDAALREPLPDDMLRLLSGLPDRHGPADRH